MAALLSKFRIAYSDLVVITDLSKEPKQSTRMWFARLIHQGKLAGKSLIIKTLKLHIKQPSSLRH